MEITDRGVVFDASQAPRDRRFCAWTNLTVLSDGRLLVSFHSGSAKEAPDENVVMRLSSDEGATWKTVCAGLEPLSLDGRLGSWHSGRVTELEPGWLIGAFRWLDRSVPGRPMVNPATTGTAPGAIFVMESTDDGRTWKNARRIDPGRFPAVSLMGAPLILQNGDIAVPCESWKDYDDAGYGRHHAILSISHDGAQTFDPPIVTATDPANRLFFWDNRLAVDPASGRMLGMFWTHDREEKRDVNAHVAWGAPDGQEWTSPLDAGFAGQIPTPLILPDGRVLVVYVHRHHPPSLRAMLSSDFGKTWDAAGELVYYQKEMGQEAGMVQGKRQIEDYYADMRVWTFGHTQAGLLPDGDVIVVYYAGDMESLSIHWVRISL